MAHYHRSRPVEPTLQVIWSRLKWYGPNGPHGTPYMAASITKSHNVSPQQHTVKKLDFNFSVNGGIAMEPKKLGLKFKNLAVKAAIVWTSMNTGATI